MHEIWRSNKVKNILNWCSREHQSDITVALWRGTKKTSRPTELDIVDFEQRTLTCNYLLGDLPWQLYFTFVKFKYLFFPLNCRYWQKFALDILQLHIEIHNFQSFISSQLATIPKRPVCPSICWDWTLWAEEDKTRGQEHEQSYTCISPVWPFRRKFYSRE